MEKKVRRKMKPDRARATRGVALALCAHCGRGSGEKTPHKRKGLESEEDQQNKIPRMALNYHFMSTRDAENGDNPVLAMKDESTGNRYLRAVGQKGVEGMEWLVKDLHEELESRAHGRRRRQYYDQS